MRARSAAFVALAMAAVAAGASSAHAGPVRGVVLVDADGDGRASAGDPPLAGAVVGFEDESFATAGDDGRFGFIAASAGIVWVRVPDGFHPGPVWAAVPEDGDDDLTLLVRPHPVRPPLRFVHASDTHLGQASILDAARALDAALAGDDPPHFVVLTGDVTQNGFPLEVGEALALVDGLAAPLVAAAGNHDFLDTAAEAWRRGLGPSVYSFDAGGVHFIVLDGERPLESRLAFLARDARLSPPGMPRMAFLHYPLTMPYDRRLHDALVGAGVSHIFTGHYHANRTLDFGALVEHNVQPLVMGGMSLVPAGYQVVTVEPGLAGAPPAVRVEPRFVSDGPLAAVVYPRGAACLPPGRFEALVAVVEPATPAEVHLSVDGAAPLPAARRGGLAHGHVFRVDHPGEHILVAEIVLGDRRLVRRQRFCVAPPGVATPASAPPAPLLDPAHAWPQLGGGPSRGSSLAEPLRAPLSLTWAVPVGGHVVAPPVHAGGRVFVAVTTWGYASDASDTRGASDARGGVVALDARTGRLLWEARDSRAVAGSPVVVGERVIVAGRDGNLRAYAAATGATLWQTELAPDLAAQARQLYAGPVASADGRLVFAGHMYRFAALDAATGARAWELTPSTDTFVSLSRSTPALAPAGDALFAVFGHGDGGLLALATADGATRWTLADAAIRGMVAPPLATAGALYLGASDGSLLRVDPADGRVIWQRALGQGAEYGFWMRSAPALARGHLVVASQMGPLVALDAETGTVRWQVYPPDGPLRPVHYGFDGRGATAGPVITGDTVWAAGDDGVLRALELGSGHVDWTIDLGAPLYGGLAPAATADGRGLLFVAGFDGVVRALAGAPPAPAATPPSPTRPGCGVAPTSHYPAGASALLWLAALAWVWKSRTRGVRLTRGGYPGVHQDSHAHRAPR